MFCPNCKVEYAIGSRECSDCSMPLVENLPADNASSSASDPDEMEVLWSGTNKRFAAVLTNALDRADLLYGDKAVKLEFLPASPGVVRRVSVRRGDREAAEQILQDLIDGKPLEPNDAARDAAIVNPWRLNRRVLGRASDDESSFDVEYRLPDPGWTGSPTPDDIIEDFDADKATCEVWAGENSNVAAYLNDCLRGVGIGCVAVPDGARVRVLVMPATETRAREIVREVVDAEPSE
jgi:hypothetical protein